MSNSISTAAFIFCQNAITIILQKPNNHNAEKDNAFFTAIYYISNFQTIYIMSKDISPNMLFSERDINLLRIKYGIPAFCIKYVEADFHIVNGFDSVFC